MSAHCGRVLMHRGAGGMLLLLACLVSMCHGAAYANETTRRLTASRPDIRVGIIMHAGLSALGYDGLMETTVQDYVNNERPFQLGDTEFGLDIQIFVVQDGSSTDGLLVSALDNIASGKDADGNDVGSYHVVVYSLQDASSTVTFFDAALSQRMAYLNCGLVRETQWRLDQNATVQDARYTMSLTSSHMVYLQDPIRNSQQRGLQTLTVIMTRDNEDLYEMAIGGIVYALDVNQEVLQMIGPTANWCEQYASWTETCMLLTDSTTNISTCECARTVGSDGYSWWDLSSWLLGVTFVPSTEKSVYELTERAMPGVVASSDVQVLSPTVFDYAMDILTDVASQGVGQYGRPDVILNAVVRYAHVIYALHYLEYAPQMGPMPWIPVNSTIGSFSTQPDGRILPAVWENGSSFIGHEGWGATSQDMMTSWSLSSGSWFNTVNYNDDLFVTTEAAKVLLGANPNYEVMSAELACMSAVVSLIYTTGVKFFVDDNFGTFNIMDQREGLRFAISTTNDENLWGQNRFNQYNLNEGRSTITWQSLAPAAFGEAAPAGVVFPTTQQDHEWVMRSPRWEARFNCSPGQYNTGFECGDCTLGTYAVRQSLFWSLDNSEENICLLCGAGQQARSTGQTACELCPPGWYHEEGKLELDDEGVLRDGFCGQCPIGQAQANAGQTACTSCRPGYYSNGTGVSQCIACTPGNFQQGIAQTQCEACVAGQFANFEASSTCASCAMGQYQGGSGATACTECDEIMTGSSTESFGETASLACKCPPGSIDPRSHGGDYDRGCITCPKGVFCDGYPVYKCQTGTFAPTCQCVDQVCESGNCPQYLACGQNVSETWDESCPVLTDATITSTQMLSDCTFSHRCMWLLGLCPESNDPVVSAREVLEENYFANTIEHVLEGDALLLDHRVDVTEGVWLCQSPEACIGQDAVTDPVCADKREGLNCGKCVANYASGGGNPGAECTKCNYALLLLVPFAMTCFYALVGYFHYLWNEREKLIEGVEPVLASVTIDIALNFIQSLGIFEKMSINWPKEFEAILAIAKLFLFDVDVLRPGCLWPVNLASAYLGRLSLPIVLSLAFLTWWPLSRLLNCMTGGKFKRFNIWAMFNTVGMIVQALYISLVTGAASLVECYESPNGGKAIRSYPFATCPRDFTMDFGESPEFMAMIPFFILALLLYVVGIFGLFVWLSVMAPKKLDDLNFRKATRFLVFQLQPAMWWYQVVLMARSALLALVPVFSPDNGYIQVLMFATVLVVSLVSHMALWPFAERMANLLEVWDISLLMGMLVIATWFVYNDADTEPVQAERLSIMLIILVVAVIGVVAMVVAYGVWESCNLQRVNERHKQEVARRLEALKAAVTILHDKGQRGDDTLRNTLANLSYVDLWHLERLAHLSMLELCGLMPVKLSERRLSRNSASFQVASADNLRQFEEQAQKVLVEKLSRSFEKQESAAQMSQGKGSTLEWDQQGEAEVWV